MRAKSSGFPDLVIESTGIFCAFAGSLGVCTGGKTPTTQRTWTTNIIVKYISNNIYIWESSDMICSYCSTNNSLCIIWFSFSSITFGFKMNLHDDNNCLFSGLIQHRGSLIHSPGGGSLNYLEAIKSKSVISLGWKQHPPEMLVKHT